MVVIFNDHNGDHKGYMWTDNGEVKSTPSVAFILDPKYIVKQPGTGKIMTKYDGDDFLKVLPVMFSGVGMQAAIFTDPRNVNNG